jgi:carbonic anhydrase
MQKLIDGVAQFVQTVQQEEQELFARLAASQDPDVLFVTCSDSRIAPHLMTQTGPGDLFVIRNAGNIIPPHDEQRATGEAATVEYATSALGVKDIIVCGHSNCGAMNGLLNLGEVAKSLPVVEKWLDHCAGTLRIAREQLDHLSPDARLDRTIELNTLAQLSNLRTHPSVAARLKRGDIRLHAWVYDIASGHVRAFDSERGEFVSLVDPTISFGAVSVEHAAAAHV